MQTREIIANYEATIASLEREMSRAASERVNLDDWERKAALFEAQLVVSGQVDGKNAEERKANLTLALEVLEAVA
jgi:hypothetical protein